MEEAAGCDEDSDDSEREDVPSAISERVSREDTDSVLPKVSFVCLLCAVVVVFAVSGAAVQSMC